MEEFEEKNTKTLQINNMDNAVIVMGEMRKKGIKVIRHYVGVVYEI